MTSGPRRARGLASIAEGMRNARHERFALNVSYPSLGKRPHINRDAGTVESSKPLTTSTQEMLGSLPSPKETLKEMRQPASGTRLPRTTTASATSSLPTSQTTTTVISGRVHANSLQDRLQHLSDLLKKEIDQNLCLRAHLTTAEERITNLEAQVLDMKMEYEKSKKYKDTLEEIRVCLPGVR